MDLLRAFYRRLVQVDPKVVVVGRNCREANVKKRACFVDALEEAQETLLERDLRDEWNYRFCGHYC